MRFVMDEAVEVLSATPAVFRALLEGKSENWLRARKAPDAFSAIDVIGHLMHAELTDWIPRVRILLATQDQTPFEAFDRFGFGYLVEGRGLGEILDEFARLRTESLAALQAMAIEDDQLGLPGRHPELGPVTLRNLLATWVVHDLGHIAQVVKTMAVQYREAAGPWQAYTTILHD